MTKSRMFGGTIRDRYGDVESACTRPTTAGVAQWFEEHGINFYWAEVKANKDNTEFTYQRGKEQRR